MGGFFHTPKPKKFKIEPRYWDPEKEEREDRIKRIKNTLTNQIRMFNTGGNHSSIAKVGAIILFQPVLKSMRKNITIR